LETSVVRREDAHRLIPEGELVRALNAEKFRLERALQKLQAKAPEGHFLPDSDLSVVFAKRIHRAGTGAVEALRDKGQAFQAIAQTVTATLSWIRDGKPSGCMLKDYDGPEPRLDGKETLLDAIERLRRRAR
jgi:hypothetical protein